MFLKPRFALLGDWNCTWYLSFNVPTADILKQHIHDSSYKFEYDLSHLFPNMPSDKYELRIALPEGAKIKKHSLGGAKADNITEELSYGYLDFFGRPTLVFTFKNYLPSIYQNAKLKVEYTLESHLIWIEPVYLVVGLFICFGIYIVFSKMDLTFGSDHLEERYQNELEARHNRERKERRRIEAKPAESEKAVAEKTHADRKKR